MSIEFGPEQITALALGIALSACCGFRVFVPLLAASIGVKAGVFPVPEGMLWLGSWLSIIIFTTAAVIEIIAYYVPFLDNLLDTIAAPMAITAGALLTSSVIPFTDEPAIRWGLGIIAGGSAAGTLHLGTGFVRILSSKFTAGTGNAVVATGENVAVAGGVAMSFIVPVFCALMFSGLVIIILYLAYRKLTKKKPMQV